MGYRRGYDCDICGKASEKEEDFIGLDFIPVNTIKEMAVDSADFHVCTNCAKFISKIWQERQA